MKMPKYESKHGAIVRAAQIDIISEVDERGISYIDGTKRLIFRGTYSDLLISKYMIKKWSPQPLDYCVIAENKSYFYKQNEFEDNFTLIENDTPRDDTDTQDPSIPIAVIHAAAKVSCERLKALSSDSVPVESRIYVSRKIHSEFMDAVMLAMQTGNLSNVRVEASMPEQKEVMSDSASGCLDAARRHGIEIERKRITEALDVEVATINEEKPFDDEVCEYFDGILAGLNSAKKIVNLEA